MIFAIVEEICFFVWRGAVVVVVVLRKRKFCLVRPELEDGSSTYRSAKNGAKRGF